MVVPAGRVKVMPLKVHPDTSTDVSPGFASSRKSSPSDRTTSGTSSG
jgi:hypothetical protein